MDEVAENSDELMERYLEGEEISHEELVTTLKQGVTGGQLFPVTCGVATKNLGTNRLLEALVEDLPSPAMRGAIRALDADGEQIVIEPDTDGELVAYVFKTLADPYTGRINMLRVHSGVLSSTRRRSTSTRKAKERIGQLAAPRGKEITPWTSSARATSARSPSCKRDARRRRLAAKDASISFAPLDLPAPVMAFAFEPKTKGDEEKAVAAVRRLRRRTRRSTSIATRRPASRSSPG